MGRIWNWEWGGGGGGGGGVGQDAERIAKAVGVRSSSTPDGFCRVHLPGLGQDTQVLWMEELQTVTEMRGKT